MSRPKGYKMSEESKKKISLKKLGVKCSAETCKKMSIAKKGIDPINRVNLYTPELNKQRAEKLKERPDAWKGEDAVYITKHIWVSRWLGKPCKCTHCGTEAKRMYHWANISGEYHRDLNDWVRLCVPCHSKFDRNRI